MSLTLRSTFPIFPGGLPGLGLVLLRVSAGAALVCFGSMAWLGGADPKGLSLALATLSATCGLFLLAGLLTPVVSSLGALLSLGTALSLTTVSMLNVTSTKISAVFTGVIAVALLCLGPGAYSLDARRHGRREIIIPARPPLVR